MPEHNPLVLAKTAATLDRLSGGRFILGAGVGWLAEEFEALGIPFERRGARTREYIEVMRKLWREWRSSHQGQFVKFTRCVEFPQTCQQQRDTGVVRWREQSGITTRRRIR